MNGHLFHPTNEISSTFVQPFLKKLEQNGKEAASNLGTPASSSPKEYREKFNKLLDLDKRRAKMQNYFDDKKDKEDNPISYSVKKGIGSLKNMMGLGEFSMPTYLNLANHIMDKSHDASVKANDYKADLKKTLAQHYNNKALRLFSVADNIESHIHRNGHLFKK